MSFARVSINSKMKNGFTVKDSLVNLIAKIGEKITIRRTKFFDKPIVTLICMCKIFYPAEEYHQKYLKKNIG